MSASSRTVGVLLAGGRAARFGGLPKGLALVGEQRIADRVLTALRGASDECLVVANDPRAAGWFPGVRVVSDDSPGKGPLEGVATALRAADGASVLVVAWDMPYVTAPLLRGMRALGQLGRPAVVPVRGESLTEPLCAWYAGETLARCEALLARGETRARALVESLPDALLLASDMLEAYGDLDRLFLSVDEPEQLDVLGGQMPRIGPAPRR